MPISVCVILDIYVQIFTNKKRLIQNQSLAIQNRVENIGFDRRKQVFGEAGIPLKNKYLIYSRNRLSAGEQCYILDSKSA